MIHQADGALMGVKLIGKTPRFIATILARALNQPTRRIWYETRNPRDWRADWLGHCNQRHPIRRDYRGPMSLVIAAVLAAILVIILDL